MGGAARLNSKVRDFVPCQASFKAALGLVSQRNTGQEALYSYILPLITSETIVAAERAVSSGRAGQ